MRTEREWVQALEQTGLTGTTYQTLRFLLDMYLEMRTLVRK